MKNISTKKLNTNNANLSRLRFILQILFFILFVYGGYFAINLGQNLPTFSCPYNSGSPGNCYLISLQHMLHSSFSDFISWRGVAFLKGLLIFVVLFLFLNKAWCGFVCPLGTLQDWITKLRVFFKVKFTRYDQLTFKRLKWIKYILLLALIVIPLSMSNSFFGLPHASHDMSAPFCQTCPGRTVLPLATGDTSQFFIDFRSTESIVLSSLGIIFTALFFIGSFFKKRFFCFFCPMSTLQFLFSKIGFLRLIKDGDKCTKCNNCSRVCDIGIKEIATDITSKNIVKDDCMMCFKCVEACPENDCLKVKLFGISLFKSTHLGFFKRFGDTLNNNQ